MVGQTATETSINKETPYQIGILLCHPRENAAVKMCRLYHRFHQYLPPKTQHEVESYSMLLVVYGKSSTLYFIFLSRFR